MERALENRYLFSLPVLYLRYILEVKSSDLDLGIDLTWLVSAFT